MVKKIFFSFVLLLLFLWLLAPNDRLYYKLEHLLQSHGVVITEKSLSLTPWSLTIQDADVTLNGAKIAKIEYAKLITLLFYHKLIINNLQFNDIVAGTIGKKVSLLTATHHILKPTVIELEIRGDLGEAKGYIELKNKVVVIRFEDKFNIDSLKKWLKRDEKGWYYETTFN